MNLLDIAKANYKRNRVGWNIVWGILAILCIFGLYKTLILYIEADGFQTIANWISWPGWGLPISPEYLRPLNYAAEVLKDVPFGVVLGVPFRSLAFFTCLILGVSCYLSRKNTLSLTAKEQMSYTSIVILFHSIILLGFAIGFSKIYLIVDTVICTSETGLAHPGEDILVCYNNHLWLYELCLVLTFIIHYTLWSPIRGKVSTISISWIKWSVFIVEFGMFLLVGIVVLILVDLSKFGV